MAVVLPGLLVAGGLVALTTPENEAEGVPFFVVPGTICDKANTAYSKSFAPIDAVGSVSYSVTNSSLPAGLSFNSSTGVLSGTTPSAGSTTYSFTLSATDSATPPDTVVKTFDLTFQTEECGVAAVAMAATRSTSTNEQDFDLSNRISLPGTWAANQQISVGLSFTASDTDSALAFRGGGGCTVDVSSSTTSSIFGTTQGNGRITLTGGGGQIWIINDRTPEVAIYGPADLVRQAVARVRVRCNSTDDFIEKYLRLGVVPTETPENIAETGGSTTANGGLFYVFSTQHYYRYTRATSGLTNTDYRRIRELWNYAKSQTISVNGRIKGVPSASQRKGWVATLTSQDEILLTNSIGVQGNAPMIGTTDVGIQTTARSSYTYDGQATNQSSTWTYDSSAWGTPSSGSTSDCSTREDNYRWLGPDSWCQVVPAPSRANGSLNASSRYWLLSSGGWTTTNASASNFTIDFNSTNHTDSSVSPFSGRSMYHQWQDGEPNASGDFIYMGYNGEFWDDAAPGDGYENTGFNVSRDARHLFIEFCSPATDSTTCPPADEAVAATQFVAVDNSARQTWRINSQIADANVSSNLNCTNANSTETVSGAYRIVTIRNSGSGTGSCTWTPPTRAVTAEILLVGGGGAGGYNRGGGGGGGATVIHSSVPLSGAVTISVGRGGAAATGTPSTWLAGRGNAGDDTTVSTSILRLVAGGGSGGNACSWSGTACNSGGNSNTGGAGGTGTNGTLNLTGGSGGNGNQQSSASSVQTSGNDGNLAQTRGVNGRYGGGGGGSSGSGTATSGGLGGGAAGVVSPTVGISATASTGGGGGGGGGNSTAGNGGSGIVVIKFTMPLAANTTAIDVDLEYSGTNSMNSRGTMVMQSATFDGTTCSNTWTAVANTATSSFPSSQTVSRENCVRWTFDPNLLTASNGAVRPADSGSFQPTSNLTSPVLIVPAETFVRLPSVLHVDPRASQVRLPALPIAGHPTAMICLYQVDSLSLTGIGTPMSSPVISFDVGENDEVDTSAASATVERDNSATMAVSGSQANVQTALGTTLLKLSSGRFSTSRFLLFRAIPTMTGYTTSCDASGSQLNAHSSGARVVQIRPFGLNMSSESTINLGRR